MNESLAIHSISFAKHGANLIAKMPMIMAPKKVWAVIKHFEIESGRN